MYEDTFDTDEHLLRWQQIMLASTTIPLLIVGLGDLHGWAAAPFLLVEMTGFAVSVRQLWLPLTGRGSAPHRPRN